MMQTPNPQPLAENLIREAEAIAEHVYGPAPDKKARKSNQRRIYHLVDNHGFPAFKLGGVLCARRARSFDGSRRKSRRPDAMAAPPPAPVRRPPIHVGSILKSSTETVTVRLIAFAGHDLIYRLADIEPFEAERLRASTAKFL